MLTLLLALQPAPATAERPAPADIEFGASATAQRVVVQSRGQTSLTVHAAVNGREVTEGNRVDVDAPALPLGQQELRNVNVRVHATTHLTDSSSPPRPQTQELDPAPQR